MLLRQRKKTDEEQQIMDLDLEAMFDGESDILHDEQKHCCCAFLSPAMRLVQATFCASHQHMHTVG